MTSLVDHVHDPFASVVRVRDGLPLSASTDFYHAQEFLECRRQLKTLALRLAQYPSRGSAESRDFHTFFFIRDVACMAICSHQCPTAMAFYFLETLWWDFTASHDSSHIGLASRPYAFLEFEAAGGGGRMNPVEVIYHSPLNLGSADPSRQAADWLCELGTQPYSVIQKVKWRFNHMSPSQMKSCLEKIQEELEFQPPTVLSLEDTDMANGVLNGHTPVYSEPAPSFRMEPVTALGVLSLVLNIMCAALNLIRGVHLVEHSLQVAQEEIGNILAFLVPFVACIFQCYLYLFYSPARTVKVLLMLAFICLGNMYLHGLRNLWQILFHIGVAFLSSHQILTRQLQEKQSDCGV